MSEDKIKKMGWKILIGLVSIPRNLEFIQYYKEKTKVFKQEIDMIRFYVLGPQLR